MNGCKTVWISEKLHGKLKRECTKINKAGARPRVTLQDRIETLIGKGLMAEVLLQG